ncbi:glycerophosphoryl diester phosphodiesterase [Halovenus aranensis]|jgi:glycerophosphoryl diester phosphodiesterase|uniref:Glycerophosphoryl diester phosphodiesterase n=1 Tax=Halovenus aranensis TaxID=890420 RepID=A0A1G8YFT3_9EURY|nr:glycerophosphodiester phosphodiesterase [Halovenus aranensis]SDK01563.1 glycerophosphoryl diester phosphodiesterase [Halovenus aranensis]
MLGDNTGGFSRRSALKTTAAVFGTAAMGGTVAGRSDSIDHNSNDDSDDSDENTDDNEGRQDDVHVTAHRGYAGLFPENTVAAAVGASRLGADRIEIDLEATEDGEIVVFHDAKLDDLTDESGAVGETASETVLQAEVLGSGETIPTLAEVLNVTDPAVTVNLEFKDSGPLTWTEFTERTLEIARQYPGEFYASSFDPDALRAVRDVDDSVDVAPIFYENREENVEIARELDAEAMNPYHGLLDEEFVATAHEEGRELNVWTIDSWQVATGPIDVGADGLIADYPMVFQTGQYPGMED